MLYKWATQAIPAWYKVVSVTVLATATSWASSADAELVWGKVIGIVPAGNQDQFVDNVVLTSSTWVVTVTLAAAATADNVFKVTVARATGNNA